MSATNTYMHPGKGKPVKNNENGGPTSTGGGGIPASLKVKAAGTKDASVLNVTLNKPTSAGDKVNNLF